MKTKATPQLQPPQDFLKRKAAVSMSTSELARRSDLSLNTVKSYLIGKSVRETTVQSLHEALTDYEAQQSGAAPLPSNVSILFDKTQSSLEMGRQSVRLCSDFVRVLEAAVQKTFVEGKPLDGSIVQEIQLQLRKANAILGA